MAKSAAGHDLAELTAKLDKATAGQTVDAATASDILKDLLNTTVTAQSLQSTGLGKLVNRIRKAVTNEEVQEFAKKVLTHFKATVLPSTPVSKAKSIPTTPTAATAAAAASAGSGGSGSGNGSGSAAAADSTNGGGKESAQHKSGDAPTAVDSKSGVAVLNGPKMPAPKNYTQSYINKSKLVPSASTANANDTSAAASPAPSPTSKLTVRTSSAAGAAAAAVATPASPLAKGGASTTASSPVAAAGGGTGPIPPGLQRFATGAVVESGHGEFKIGLADKKRTKIQELCLAALGAPPTGVENPLPAVEIAVRLENALHQRFTNPTEYNEQYRSISFNLKDPQNPDLNRDLFAGVLQPEELVDMKPAEMASAALKEQREADRKWMRDATRSDWNKNKSMTDMWRCGKCKERKCSYYQMQTRSADEPMTTFVRCLNCGNRWKC